jgi:peptidoglycan hydrolase-like protein with peptidoglycan-binding domain
MDDQTRNAIRQFQQAKGLNATGELDQETRSALLSGAAAGTAPGSNR